MTGAQRETPKIHAREFVSFASSANKESAECLQLRVITAREMTDDPFIEFAFDGLALGDLCSAICNRELRRPCPPPGWFFFGLRPEIEENEKSSGFALRQKVGFKACHNTLYDYINL